MDGLFLPAPPRLSHSELIAKLVRANEVFPEKEEGLMKYAEQVPLGLMLPARDLMRGPGQQHFDRPGDAWTGLSNDIAERGILSPIFLEWSTADGYAYAGEGNTRLAVAEELGLPTVPVVVYRKSLPLQGSSRTGEIGPFEFNKRQYLLDQGMTEDMPSWEFKMEDGYVPQYFQPHYLIGFLDQRTSGRLDLPDKYRDEDDWHPYTPGLSPGQLATLGPFYHGTYTENVPSIMEHGLVPRNMVPTGRLPDWHETMMPVDGRVYLKTMEDPYEVNGPETVLRIDPTKLDPSKFRQDEDLQGEWGDDVWGALDSGYGTVAYEGTIPPEAISIHAQYE